MCRCDGMVDVADSKSAGGDSVWVRVPPPAPLRNDLCMSDDRASAFISTAKVFLRSNPQSLRWIASLFLIKPSLTCSVAPPFQNANISLVCILVFLPMLENSRTPCLFVHFTKGRVSVFLCPENNYLDS